MSSRNSGDGGWENILLVVVFCALGYVGYREVKPTVLGWLEELGLRPANLADRANGVPVDLFVDVAAGVLGLTLLVALWRGWRRLRRRGRDEDKQKRNVWR